MKSTCLDSSAWIEIAHNGPNASVFLEASRDMERVVVSTITLYEVWKYTAAQADESRAQHLVDFLRQGQVVAPDARLAVSAAKWSLKYKIAMADALIYATARDYKAKLWTRDADFEGLPFVNYITNTQNEHVPGSKGGER